MENDIDYCIAQINLMIKRSKTKIIFPIITYGLLKEFQLNGTIEFSDTQVKNCYHKAINEFKTILGHDIHIGGKYYDAYSSRNLPKYNVLKAFGNNKYLLVDTYSNNTDVLLQKIPNLVTSYINKKLGNIPLLNNPNERFELSNSENNFLNFIEKQIEINPVNFEIFCFAILKNHLEKFACKIYRDTRTSAHDQGVDLSTNFGVIYQIKKLKIQNVNSAKGVYNELQTNFSQDRINDGNVILIIDEISKDVKSFLVDMKIQTISKSELLKLAKQLDIEDRMKVLKVIYDEFSREYKSDI